QNLQRLKSAHKANFPNRYRIPPEVSTYIAFEVFSRFSEQYRAAPYSVSPRIMQEDGGIVICSLKIGGNPLPFLALPYIKPNEIDAYLGHCARGSNRDYKGYTLMHAHCLSEDFMGKYFPVLLKHNTDINSVSTEFPVGTVTHLLLANEKIDAAI